MNKNRIAIVTGANKGLGYAVVKSLCKKFQGIVYLTSRDEKRGIEACKKLEKLGLKPVYHQLDITNEARIEKFRHHIQDKEIEVIINNAGILFLKDATEPQLYQVEQTVLVNFFSLVNFCEAMLPYITYDGKIVNISSSSGHLCRIPSEDLRKKISSENLTLKELKSLINDYVEAVKRNEDLKDSWGESPYVVSKVGVNAYTFLLQRNLLSRGVKVNCIHPGYVISDMTRGSGSVTPEDAAEVVVKLALEPPGTGLYIWSNGNPVPWDGPDPLPVGKELLHLVPMLAVRGSTSPVEFRVPKEFVFADSYDEHKTTTSIFRRVNFINRFSKGDRFRPSAVNLSNTIVT